MTDALTNDREMQPETLEALLGSIAKWEAIVAGTGKDFGAYNCPLCQKFVRKDCKGCPVAEAVDNSGCHGTPYYDFDAGDKAGEQRMLDFLKSLLPSELPPALRETPHAD